jgi:NADH-quinone oxidoreductase subunit N
VPATGLLADAPAAVRTPLGVTAAIALTAVAGIVLSGAPQIVLRYAQGTLL